MVMIYLFHKSCMHAIYSKILTYCYYKTISTLMNTNDKLYLDDRTIKIN